MNLSREEKYLRDRDPKLRKAIDWVMESIEEES